jgi:hypothetical protein
MLRERLLKPEVASCLAEKAWEKLKTGQAPDHRYIFRRAALGNWRLSAGALLP